ncbi:MAG TPA: alpha/beta hydrolase [Gaiellaceae bacterium]|nr:alpha/beta hydrolase [Gaiellaceae bacterium]
MFLHAFPDDERMWEPQIAALQGGDVAAPRLYGRGPSLDRWAAEILDDVDGPVIVVGASMGGYTGLAMAERAPERLLALLLAGARAAADSAERRRDRDALIALLGEGGVPAGLTTTATAAELADATAAMRDRPDRSDVVRAFAGPLVVVVGEADDVLPVHEARAVAALAPRGRIEVFPGAGHLVSVEQPDAFNRVLLDFLDSV